MAAARSPDGDASKRPCQGHDREAIAGGGHSAAAREGIAWPRAALADVVAELARRPAMGLGCNGASLAALVRCAGGGGDGLHCHIPRSSAIGVPHHSHVVSSPQELALRGWENAPSVVRWGKTNNYSPLMSGRRVNFTKFLPIANENKFRSAITFLLQ